MHEQVQKSRPPKAPPRPTPTIHANPPALGRATMRADPVGALLASAKEDRDRDRSRPVEADLAARFSVRVPETPDIVPCCHCRLPVFASGPTGYRDDAPACDACLLEQAPELGMMLVLIALARQFSAIPSSRGRHDHVSLVELGAFARIYERFAAQRGPSRGLGAFLRNQ